MTIWETSCLTLLRRVSIARQACGLNMLDGVARYCMYATQHEQASKKRIGEGEDVSVRTVCMYG